MRKYKKLIVNLVGVAAMLAALGGIIPPGTDEAVAVAVIGVLQSAGVWGLANEG